MIVVFVVVVVMNDVVGNSVGYGGGVNGVAAR